MTYLGALRDDEPTLELPVVIVPEAGAVRPSGHGRIEVIERAGRIVVHLILCLVPVLMCATVLLVVLGLVPWTAIHDALGELREHDGEAASPPSRPSGNAKDGHDEPAPEPAPDPAAAPPLTAPSVQARPETTAPPPEAPASERATPPSAAPPPGRSTASARPEVRDTPSFRMVAEDLVDGPVTERAVGQLHLGMTIREVTDAIGVEGWNHWPGFHEGPVKPTDPAHQRSVAADPARWEIRIWPEQYFGPEPVEVIFRDGRAVEINR